MTVGLLQLPPDLVMPKINPINKPIKRKNFLLVLLLDNKKSWPGLFIMTGIALLAGVLKTQSAIFWGAAVDHGVSGNIDAMIFSVLGMLMFIFLDGLRTAIHYTVIGKVTEKMFRSIRIAVLNALLKADITEIENRTRSGDVALRACEDVDLLCEIIAARFSNHIRLVFQAVFAIISCFLLSWRLAAAYLFLLPIFFWLLSIVSKPLQKIQKEARDEAGKSTHVVLETLSGINSIKIFNLEEEAEKKFSLHIDNAYKRSIRANHIGMLMTAIKYTASVFQFLILFGAGVWLISLNLITVGTVMSFIALTAYITEALGLLDSMIFNVKSASSLSARIYDIMDLPPEPNGGTELPHDDNIEIINFNNFSFSYIEAQTILNCLSLIVRKGQKVALIGPSGSGKSTLIKLICRLYDTGGSQLTLFGASSKKIDIDLLRKKIAIVTQESCLFEGSIAENIRFGCESATDIEVENALKAADLWGFVSSLPKGMHTKLDEFGSTLSGGQKQRLSIARALIKNAELILLDEATSALDIQSENEVQQALDNLLRYKTAVIVAHRLSAVRHADYIYCLEKGSIIEEGTPAELLLKRGYYYNMCNQQDMIL